MSIVVECAIGRVRVYLFMVLTLLVELGLAASVLVAALLSSEVEFHVVDLFSAVQQRLRWGRVYMIINARTLVGRLASCSVAISVAITSLP